MRTIEEVLRELGYGHLYDKPPQPKPQPTFCMFCIDVPHHELMDHEGCAVCGNSGAYRK